MYLRNKTILMKAKQSNYYAVILGIILVSIILLLSVAGYFYSIPYFIEIFTLFNFLFISIHIRFLRFVFYSKGFFSTIRAIVYSYLHVN